MILKKGSSVHRIENRLIDLFFIPGTERYWIRRLKGKLMALVYHRVDDPSNHSFLAYGGTPIIPPEELANELNTLRKYGARFLIPSDLRQGTFPASDEFGVIVTFDDGFPDNYTLGVEVLDSIGIKSFFQCSAMINGDRLIPEHALYWYSSQRETAPMLLKLAHEAN